MNKYFRTKKNADNSKTTMETVNHLEKTGQVCKAERAENFFITKQNTKKK